MYWVYLDGGEIPGVLSVESGGERGILKHDGLGIGKFPVADGKDLRSWTVKTEQEGTALFGLLDEKLTTKEASRLVITSDEEHMSELALLESYTKSESYAGVYAVTLKFVEYKEAAVRTSDVPYIARPGKVPTPPKTVVFNGKNKTPFKQLLLNGGKDLAGKINESCAWVDKDGKVYDNPCTTPDNVPLVTRFINNFWDHIANPNEKKLADTIQKTMETNKAAIEEAKKKAKEKANGGGSW